MTRVLFSLLLILLPASAVRAAAPSGDDLVKAELVTEDTGIKPGRPFLIGVQFKIEPHWHIYWKNPGDAGQATEVKFDLPPGWTATELHYPVPERFMASGDILSYGYQDEVMLMATIMPSSDLKPGEQVKISAKATWLVCEKVCLPGSANVELTLPVGSSKRNSANVDLIHKWWNRTPRPSAEIGVNVSPDQDKQSGDCILRISWNLDAPKNIEWFPPASDAVNFSNIRITSEGKRTTIRYKMDSIGNKVPPATVPASAVAYDGIDGTRRGLAIPEFPFPRGNGSRDK